VEGQGGQGAPQDELGQGSAPASVEPERPGAPARVARHVWAGTSTIRLGSWTLTLSPEPEALSPMEFQAND
jgi:hypothetical protein